MTEDRWYDSLGAGKLRVRCWRPQGAPRGVLQIVHGIAEHVERYDRFASAMTRQGFLVVAEDHMGHGRSIDGGSTQGFFHGGWFTAVEDTYRLLADTRREFPELPYVLFGHSMGSFMARTILCRHPDSGIAAAVLSGTGWQSPALLAAARPLAKGFCKRAGEQNPDPALDKLVFGGYNRKIPSPKTGCDWLSRDEERVADYVADPRCGFMASTGLIRDMLEGIAFIQKPRNLGAMKKDLPVLFLSGAEDPVGDYGRGVRKTAAAFRKAGMERLDIRLYPQCRHELLNERIWQEVLGDLLRWLEEKGIFTKKVGETIN